MKNIKKCSNDNNFVNVKCFKCDKKDYYKSNCFNFKKEEKKTNKNDIL